MTTKKSAKRSIGTTAARSDAPADERRRGRPPKPAAAGTRVSLGLKVTPEIKGRLDQAARANGRTQSQEAEARLVRSFEREELVGEVLGFAFGERLAGILLMLGKAMAGVGQQAAFGRSLSLSARYNWFDDPHAFDQSVIAAHHILETLRPKGPIIVPQLSAAIESALRNGEGLDNVKRLGAARLFAAGVMGEGATGRPDQGRGPVSPETIHRLLGPLAARLASEVESGNVVK